MTQASQPWTRTDWAPHALLAAAICSIATFGFVDKGQDSRWLFWSLRLLGAGAGVEAVREYRRRRPVDVAVLQPDLRAELQDTYERQFLQLEQQFRTETARLQQAYQAETIRINQQLQGEKAKLQQALNAANLHLQEEQRKLQQSSWAKEKWVEQQVERLEADKAALQQSHEENLAAAKQNLAAAKERLLKEMEQLWQNLQDQARGEVQKLQSEVQLRDKIIGDLQTQLARASKVKFAAGTTRTEWIANQAIEYFWEFEIPVDHADDATIDGVDHVWLTPRQTVDSKKVKEVCTVISEQLDGIDKAEAKVEGGVIHLELTTNAEKKSKREVQALTVEGYDYFRQAIGKSNHDLVTGGTGSGKSTLVSNLIDAASTDLKEEIIKSRSDWNIQIIPDVAIYISDPKFPRTEWYLNGQRVKPQYRGFEKWTDPDGFEHPSALDGYAAMDQEVRARLNRAMLADHYNQQSVEQPAIFVLDEAEQLIAENSKQASELVLFATRVGRSELIRCIVLGQNCNCSAYGLQKPHLNNFTRWFLGDTIEKGIEEVCISSVQKRKYRDELVRLQQVSKTDSNRKYFALVKFPNERPYFVYLPPPGYFASQTYKPADLDQAIELSPLQFSEEDEKLAGMDLSQLKEIAEEAAMLGDDERARLERIYQKAEEPLPEHLRIILDLAIAIKGQWLTIGKLRSQRSQFKDAKSVPESIILAHFEDLVNRGLGELSDDGRKFRYENQ